MKKTRGEKFQIQMSSILARYLAYCAAGSTPATVRVRRVLGCRMVMPLIGSPVPVGES